MLARKSPSIVVFAILVTAMLCVASCTTTTTRYGDVRPKTAQAIGGVTPEQVKISNLHTWGGSGYEMSVSPVGGNWEAETPKGHYQCQSYDMLKRSANCIKR